MNSVKENVCFKTATQFALALLIATCSAGICNSQAQDNNTQDNTGAARSKVIYDETLHEKATVQDINYGKRELTLKEPDGTTERYAVSPAVKNFPQIKKGDQIDFDYRESVLLTLQKPGEAPAPTGRSEAFATRPAGEKPGAAATTVSQITATVENVDRAKREVTLRGPQGNVRRVHVDPSIGDLSHIKKGDQITAARTEELIVAVEPPGNSR